MPPLHQPDDFLDDPLRTARGCFVYGPLLSLALWGFIAIGLGSLMSAGLKAGHDASAELRAAAAERFAAAPRGIDMQREARR